MLKKDPKLKFLGAKKKHPSALATMAKMCEKIYNK